MQNEFLAADAQLPVAQVRSMADLVSTSIARQNFNMLLLTIFGAIALLLAAVGVYGIMSYSVEQGRTTSASASRSAPIGATSCRWWSGRG